LIILGGDGVLREEFLEEVEEVGGADAEVPAAGVGALVGEDVGAVADLALTDGLGHLHTNNIKGAKYCCYSAS
jgi:hypothetical protein